MHWGSKKGLRRIFYIWMHFRKQKLNYLVPILISTLHLNLISLSDDAVLNVNFQTLNSQQSFNS